jgi:anti-sigma regulatory factor (Ser/Thr protein kinase)
LQRLLSGAATVDEATYTDGLWCHSFVNGRGITAAASACQMALERHTNWSLAEIGSFGAMVSEIAENVLQHSSDPAGGVAAVQIHAGEKVVELAVADCGVGIRHSLARNSDYGDIGDDLTAIHTAIGPGATSDPGAAGGYGLFLARLVTGDNGGRFLVRSGDASYEQSDMRTELRRLPRLQGTLVFVEARTDHPLDYDRVDDWLGEPGGLQA